MRERYGHLWPSEASDLAIELAVLRDRLDTGRPAYEHWRNALYLLTQTQQRIHPFVITPWTEERLKILCRHMLGGDRFDKYMVVWGPGAAGKTVDFGTLAMLYWLVDPTDTLVICASTSQRALDRKIWGVVKQAHQMYAPNVGELHESERSIIAHEGTKFGGIYGIAVWAGNLDAALANAYGTHTRRVMLVIDEAQGTKERIIEARVNFRMGCEELIVVLMGNPTGISTPLGVYSEPEDGWSTLTMDRTEWPTKRGGWVYWFDGKKSPAVKDPKKYPWLINAQQLEWLEQHYGAHSVSYIVMGRGFMPLGALESGLFTEGFAVQSRALEPSFGVALENVRRFGGFDPAVTGHGDAGVYVFAEVGMLPTQELGIQLMGEEAVTLSAEEEMASLQMARSFVDKAFMYQVPFQNLCVDATSVQAAIADMVDLVASRRQGRADVARLVQRLSFSAKPSDFVIPGHDEPARFRCADRITELYLLLYHLMQRQRIRGMSYRQLDELRSRALQERHGKLKLESKVELRQRGISSPNYADALLVLLHVIERYYGAPALLGTKNMQRRLDTGSAVVTLVDTEREWSAIRV